MDTLTGAPKAQLGLGLGLGLGPHRGPKCSSPNPNSFAGAPRALPHDYPSALITRVRVKVRVRVGAGWAGYFVTYSSRLVNPPNPPISSPCTVRLTYRYVVETEMVLSLTLTKRNYH